MPGFWMVSFMDQAKGRSLKDATYTSPKDSSLLTIVWRLRHLDVAFKDHTKRMLTETSWIDFLLWSFGILCLSYMESFLLGIERLMGSLKVGSWCIVPSIVPSGRAAQESLTEMHLVSWWKIRVVCPLHMGSCLGRRILQTDFVTFRSTVGGSLLWKLLAESFGRVEQQMLHRQFGSILLSSNLLCQAQQCVWPSRIGTLYKYGNWEQHRNN